MSLNFCSDILKVGSEFGVNIIKAQTYYVF